MLAAGCGRQRVGHGRHGGQGRVDGRNGGVGGRGVVNNGRLGLEVRVDGGGGVLLEAWGVATRY